MNSILTYNELFDLNKFFEDENLDENYELLIEENFIKEGLFNKRDNIDRETNKLIGKIKGFEKYKLDGEEDSEKITKIKNKSKRKQEKIRNKKSKKLSKLGKSKIDKLLSKTKSNERDIKRNIKRLKK